MKNKNDLHNRHVLNIFSESIESSSRRNILRNVMGFFLYCLALVGNEARATYFNISTDSLIGQTGLVAFDFIDGGSPNNRFTITNFDFGIGSSIASTSLTGDVAGDVSTDIFFGDSAFFNEFMVNLTFGNNISFDIEKATNLAPDASSFPDALSVFLLDNTGQSLVSTSDPTGSNSLFRWDFGSSPDANIYSASVTVPEPSIIFFLLVGIPTILFFSQRNKKGDLTNEY